MFLLLMIMGRELVRWEDYEEADVYKTIGYVVKCVHLFLA